ncbi:MAG: 50S ribosomal protein L10 [Minisyncoccia bacterium]|jgi:large subunit ribosomal protein L10
MISKSKKIEIVKELTDLIKLARAIYITGFSGLSVQELSKLRKMIRDVKGKAKVAKKTLADIAFKRNNIALSVKESIKEPLMFEFGLEDPIVLAKVLWQFSKQNEKLKILGGYLEGQVLNAQDIKSLAQLPSREVLLGRLVSSLTSPIRNFNYVLKGNMVKLVYALSALQSKNNSLTK